MCKNDNNKRNKNYYLTFDRISLFNLSHSVALGTEGNGIICIAYAGSHGNSDVMTRLDKKGIVTTLMFNSPPYILKPVVVRSHQYKVINCKRNKVI